MIFNTWTFALFATVVVLAYWTIVPERFRRAYLVLSGSVFYAWSVPAYTVLIAGLGIVTYAIARAMLRLDDDARARTILLAVGVTAIVGLLAFFKYTHFIAQTIDDVARANILPLPHILVPLAISFFTFEFVHVLVDVYLRKITVLDPLDFAVFTMFFPTLVAGPIKRYQSFAPQLHRPPPRDPHLLALNLYRVVLGIAKKTIVADSMTPLAQAIVTPGGFDGRLDYWVGMLAYAAKIYFDFTGYSDVAIGAAGLLGLAIPENFNRPYWAQDIAAFWNRWHISLSTWIRDYVFIPLGGSRRPPLIVLLNLFVAMALCGLWHGAAWTFVVWGLWHGAGLAAHRVWRFGAVPRLPALVRGGPFPRVFSTVLTFAFVVFGWVLFATTSLTTARVVYAGLLLP
jgi:alginate O-acetyltransferase complex protein AlgI